MSGWAPRVLVIDDFLPRSLLDRLIDHAIGNEAAFAASKILGSQPSSHVNKEARDSKVCDVGLGELRPAFKQNILSRFDEICTAVGVQPFPVAKTEIELAAHGDGGFYRSHIDTYVRGGRPKNNIDRVLSAVYYFHREPKAFAGGDLVVFRIGNDDIAQVVEPRQNRLVVFPSFVRHEVGLVSCPSGKFGDARFSINCWLMRAKPNMGPDRAGGGDNMEPATL